MVGRFPRPRVQCLDGLPETGEGESQAIGTEVTSWGRKNGRREGGVLNRGRQGRRRTEGMEVRSGWKGLEGTEVEC